MGFSVENLFKKGETAHLPKPALNDRMPRLPEEVKFSEPQLEQSPSSTELEREEISELQEVHQHLNLLYSKLSKMYHILSEFGISRTDHHPQLLKNILTLSNESQSLLNSIESEAAATREKGILLKRKLMQEHELHSDKELLLLQSKAFETISSIRSHVAQVSQTIELVELTANEFLGMSGSSGPQELNIKEEMTEVKSHIRVSAQIIADIMTHVMLIKKLEENFESISLHDAVHKDLSLEVEDLKRIANIFSQVHSLFLDAVNNSNIQKIDEHSVARDALKPLIDVMHFKILPTLQKCMKYEEAIFMAAKQINQTIKALVKESSHMDTQTLHTASMQTEIRLFASNLRTTYTELNTSMIQLLESLNEQINACLGPQIGAKNKLQQLAQTSKVRDLHKAIDDAHAVVKKIVEMLDFMRRNTRAMHYYMESSQKNPGKPLPPAPSSSDKLPL